MCKRFTKSCPDLEDYNWDYFGSGHQMGEEIQQGGGRAPRRGGNHIERTGRCTEDSRNLLPGLSVLEWSCCVCVSLRWTVHYFFRRSILYVPFFGSNLQPTQRLADSAPNSETWTAACHELWPPHTHTHTQAADPITCSGHEGIWTWKEDGL